MIGKMTYKIIGAKAGSNFGKFFNFEHLMKDVQRRKLVMIGELHANKSIVDLQLAVQTWMIEDK